MPDMPGPDSTYNTMQGKNVQDTKMLSGVAQNSLYGKNVTKQDTRSNTPSGKLGGKGEPGGV